MNFLHVSALAYLLDKIHLQYTDFPEFCIPDAAHVQGAGHLWGFGRRERPDAGGGVISTPAPSRPAPINVTAPGIHHALGSRELDSTNSVHMPSPLLGRGHPGQDGGVRGRGGGHGNAKKAGVVSRKRQAGEALKNVGHS